MDSCLTALAEIQGRRDRQRARKAHPRRVDPDASGSLRRVGSRHHFGDYAVKVPQPGLVVPWMIAEIEERGAVQTAIRELQPDWLIDPDAIAAPGASQKSGDLNHDGSFLAGFVDWHRRYGEHLERTTGLSRLSARSTTERSGV